MKELRPSYYKEFHCIGGACTDTCCAGWEIDVDDITYEKYQQLPEALKKHICSQIGEEGEDHFFKLREGRRCPFLNQENLCDIFIQAGEDYLCDICREHPRFYNWIGSYTEVGLGLCCEEAQRLILGNPAPAVFEEIGDETEAEDMLLESLLQARNTLFAIVQNRKQSIFARMRQAAAFAERLQDILDFTPEEELAEEIHRLCTTYIFQGMEEKTADSAAPLQQLLTTYTTLEALDSTWTAYMEHLKMHTEELLLHKSAFLQAYGDHLYEYEHLMVYFLYRYFLESVYTMDVQIPVWFAIASVWVILLCDIDHWCQYGSLDFTQQCSIIRRYSKEIEYCTENVEAVCDICGAIDWNKLLM